MTVDDATVKETPLAAWHAAHGARMTPFAGWSMPIQYTSLLDEHRAVREAVGITDVSHMGRFIFRGDGTGEYLGSVLTRRIGDMLPGMVRYSLLTNTRGGIIDDLVVACMTELDGTPVYWVVVNASNRTRDWQCVTASLPSGITATDETDATAMVAIQGPRSEELLASIITHDLSTMKSYQGVIVAHQLAPNGMLITRTGYTGSDGFEVVVPRDSGAPLVESLAAAGAALGVTVTPVGLGARDTLRLEAAMPLYGHEMSEDVNPFEAGLARAVFLTGLDFPGRDALIELATTPPSRRRVGLFINGKRPAREGSTLWADATQIGCVTSGTFSPTLGRPIAMAYVESRFAEIGTQLVVDIRGTMTPAEVVPMPFYKR